MDGLNLPDFALRAAAVGWWVHDDGIVVIAASNLTFYKLLAVINNPADTCLRQSGEFGISLAQPTMPLEASTWVTWAPALAAAHVAPPV